MERHSRRPGRQHRTGEAIPGLAARRRPAAGPRPSGPMIHYQGVIAAATRLGFDYDDVPFELD